MTEISLEEATYIHNRISKYSNFWDTFLQFGSELPGNPIDARNLLNREFTVSGKNLYDLSEKLRKENDKELQGMLSYEDYEDLDDFNVTLVDRELGEMIKRVNNAAKKAVESLGKLGDTISKNSDLIKNIDIEDDQ